MHCIRQVKQFFITTRYPIQFVFSYPAYFVNTWNYLPLYGATNTCFQFTGMYQTRLQCGKCWGESTDTYVHYIFWRHRVHLSIRNVRISRRYRLLYWNHQWRQRYLREWPLHMMQVSFSASVFLVLPSILELWIFGTTHVSERPRSISSSLRFYKVQLEIVGKVLSCTMMKKCYFTGKSRRVWLQLNT